MQQYQRQVVAITPPIVLQMRSPFISCETRMNGLNELFNKYLYKQHAPKCEGPHAYECRYPASSRLENGKAGLYFTYDKEKTKNNHTFSCLDRGEYAYLQTKQNAEKGSDEDIKHFGRDTVDINLRYTGTNTFTGPLYTMRDYIFTGKMPSWTVPTYPEFLDLFTETNVFRDGVMRLTKHWVDVQTSQVLVWCAFVTPD